MRSLRHRDRGHRAVSARRSTYWPITLYMKEARADLEAIRRLTHEHLYQYVKEWYECRNKTKLSRRHARRLKREHNARMAGAATIYKCWRCKAWHVHSILERLWPIDEALAMLGRPTT